jgi:hypothetical protein
LPCRHPVPARPPRRQLRHRSPGRGGARAAARQARASHPRPARDVLDKQRTVPARLRWGVSFARIAQKNSNKTLQSMGPLSPNRERGREGGKKGGLFHTVSISFACPHRQSMHVRHISLHSPFIDDKGRRKRRYAPLSQSKRQVPKSNPLREGRPRCLCTSHNVRTHTTDSHYL